MPEPKHCLVVALPEGTVRHFLLSAETVTIGRTEGNAIVLDWETVSSRHCELTRRGRRYEVVDLGSTNGTKLRGESVGETPMTIRAGDSLVIGLNVKARLVELEEILDDDADARTDGSRTLKLVADLPAMPEINPVAAAVARATKGES